MNTTIDKAVYNRKNPIGQLMLTSIFLLCILMAADAKSAPPGVVLLPDIAYGYHEDQKLDVYLPQNNSQTGPVIFMVHGGAWRFGDKADHNVIQNKVSRWVNKGFIFISTNYRLLPEARPHVQVTDIMNALIFAQQNAHQWGGNAEKFILMGHSAGGHLSALLTSDFQQAESLGAKPLLGTIAIDSAAYNVVEIMEAGLYPGIYGPAFGESESYWQMMSPFYRLRQKQTPFLAICSALRQDGSCEEAAEFIDKAQYFDMLASQLSIYLGHNELNNYLGKQYPSYLRWYTAEVERFMSRLDPEVRDLLR